MDITVNTKDLRQALQAVAAHASTDHDDLRLHRVHCEVTPDNLFISAGQGFTAGMAIVSILTNQDGELTTFALSPAAVKDLLTLFKVTTPLAEEAEVRIRGRGTEHLSVQDVSGMFPGKEVVLPLTPPHDEFPDLKKTMQALAVAESALDQGVVLAGPWWATFVAATKAYREPMLVSSPKSRAMLLVLVGESFIGTVVGSAEGDNFDELARYREQDWPTRLRAAANGEAPIDLPADWSVDVKGDGPIATVLRHRLKSQGDGDDL
ncbi:hypothetical protein K0651_01965 [Ornithinimicrobium sp. Arc0846-15]|nr:hypothetical protein [Ornithinimicrobium laminariae]